MKEKKKRKKREDEEDSEAADSGSAEREDLTREALGRPYFHSERQGTPETRPRRCGQHDDEDGASSEGYDSPPESFFPSSLYSSFSLFLHREKQAGLVRQGQDREKKNRTALTGRKKDTEISEVASTGAASSSCSREEEEDGEKRRERGLCVFSLERRRGAQGSSSNGWRHSKGREGEEEKEDHKGGQEEQEAARRRRLPQENEEEVEDVEEGVGGAAVAPPPQSGFSREREHNCRNFLSRKERGEDAASPVALSEPRVSSIDAPRIRGLREKIPRLAEDEEEHGDKRTRGGEEEEQEAGVGRPVREKDGGEERERKKEKEENGEGRDEEEVDDDGLSEEETDFSFLFSSSSCSSSSCSLPHRSFPDIKRLFLHSPQSIRMRDRVLETLACQRGIKVSSSSSSLYPSHPGPRRVFFPSHMDESSNSQPPRSAFQLPPACPPRPSPSTSTAVPHPTRVSSSEAAQRSVPAGTTSEEGQTIKRCSFPCLSKDITDIDGHRYTRLTFSGVVRSRRGREREGKLCSSGKVQLTGLHSSLTPERLVSVFSR